MREQLLKFDELELDLGSYQLRRNGSVLKLEKIPMELLILLAGKKGQLVSRDEIIEKLWGKDVFVDSEQGVNTAIRKIRQILRDDPDQPKFIETVVGKGYRFVAPVSFPVEQRVAVPSWPPEPRYRTRSLVIGACALATLCVGIYLVSHRLRPHGKQVVARTLRKRAEGRSHMEYLPTSAKYTPGLLGGFESFKTVLFGTTRQVVTN